MTDGEHTGPLGEIRAKIELLKRLEAEHGFGVIIEESARLEPIPELPAGVVEVFGIFRRLEGNYFRFAQPSEISSRAAWLGRAVDLESPLGDALIIGHAIRGIPADILAAGDGGAPIRLDVTEDGVYYLDPDDYVFYYKNPDEDIEVEEFAPDIVTFFNDYVLGANYPALVEHVLGADARTHRIRKGKNAGEYTDNWLRLLVRAGLAE